MNANGHEWLTAREAALLLRVNYRTVLDAVHAGELPAVRVGRTVRISRRALERAAVPDAEPGTATDDLTAATRFEVDHERT